MSLPVIVLGAGGHAKVLIDALQRAGVEIAGATDADPGKCGKSLLGVTVFGGDDVLGRYLPDSVRLVNGLGSVRVDGARRRLFERFKDQGYQFAAVVHPSAIVAPDVVLAEGAQVMAGAVVQTGSRIGKNAIINTRAAVDHDCRIGEHAHIAPGATLSGAVEVGDGAHVGTGASIIQGIRIGRDCLVAAGAVVVGDVRDGAKVAGVPAKETG